MNLRRFVLSLLLSASSIAQALESPAIPAFIDEMVTKHHFKREELVRVFERAQYQQAVIDAISAPSTLKPWAEYRVNFINDARINEGLKFWKRNAGILRSAEKRYGVPQDILVALIGVETFYGKRAGKFRAMDALATLAFSYPPRAEFFRGELEQYLLLAREQGFDLLDIRGSYAGALGLPQFMPSSYRKYAVDFNGSGEVDLMRGRADSIGSVANYLKQFGWVTGEPVALRAQVDAVACAGDAGGLRPVAAWAASGITLLEPYAGDKSARLLDFTVAEGKEFWLGFGNFDVVMTYNNSSFYAMSIVQLAEELRKARR